MHKDISFFLRPTLRRNLVEDLLRIPSFFSNTLCGLCDNLYSSIMYSLLNMYIYIYPCLLELRIQLDGPGQERTLDRARFNQGCGIAAILLLHGCRGRI